jgi:hypothetical protein
MRTKWLTLHDRKWLNLKRPLTIVKVTEYAYTSQEVVCLVMPFLT